MIKESDIYRQNADNCSQLAEEQDWLNGEPSPVNRMAAEGASEVLLVGVPPKWNIRTGDGPRWGP